MIVYILILHILLFLLVNIRKYNESYIDFDDVLDYKCFYAFKPNVEYDWENRDTKQCVPRVCPNELCSKKFIHPETLNEIITVDEIPQIVNDEYKCVSKEKYVDDNGNKLISTEDNIPFTYSNCRLVDDMNIDEILDFKLANETKLYQNQNNNTNTNTNTNNQFDNSTNTDDDTTFVSGKKTQVIGDYSCLLSDPSCPRVCRKKNEFMDLDNTCKECPPDEFPIYPSGRPSKACCNVNTCLSQGTWCYNDDTCTKTFKKLRLNRSDCTCEFPTNCNRIETDECKINQMTPVIKRKCNKNSVLKCYNSATKSFSYYKNNDMCKLVNEKNEQIRLDDCTDECPDGSYELNNKCVCIDRRKVLNTYNKCTR
jgi:hypothetical protein